MTINNTRSIDGILDDIRASGQSYTEHIEVLCEIVKDLLDKQKAMKK
jgi:hypothetical protein